MPSFPAVQPRHGNQCKKFCTATHVLGPVDAQCNETNGSKRTGPTGTLGPGIMVRKTVQMFLLQLLRQ